MYTAFRSPQDTATKLPATQKCTISNWQLTDQYKTIQQNHPETWKAFLRRIHNIWEHDKQAEPQQFTKIKQQVMSLRPLTQEEQDGLPF